MGLFTLDEIFALRDRDSELRIAEHTTDTAGFTDLLFGAYDVVGLGFSPRICDLADQRLWRLDDTRLRTLVSSLVPNRVNAELIVAHWDDLLRLGASIPLLTRLLPFLTVRVPIVAARTAPAAVLLAGVAATGLLGGCGAVKWTRSRTTTGSPATASSPPGLARVGRHRPTIIAP